MSDFRIDERGCLTKYTGPGGDVVIPEGVTSIGNRAFRYCSSLTSVTIPESVTSIGDHAFQYCSSLTSVTIPESVTSIGEWSFYCCNSLKSVTIPEGVTSIGYWAFYGCSGLTSVTIPEGVTSIGGSAFAFCSGLTSVTIPSSVKEIGHNAFESCRGLTSVTIPDGVTSIGDGAFWGCSSLTSVMIAEGVTSIGNGAFRDCSCLTRVTIPEGVTSIYGYAFYGCSSLTSVIIPESVTSIGDSAFYGCKKLTSVTIPESVTSIGYSAFYGCEKLTSVRIPDSVTSIGEKAFMGCGSLTSVTIPESVTSIGDEVFNGCKKLKSITIPKKMLSTTGGFDEFLKSVFHVLSDEDLAALFIAKQNKRWLDVYLSGIKEKDRAEAFGEALLRRLPEKPSVRECNAAGSYMVEFGHLASAELLRRMHERLQSVKNGAKALALIQTSNMLKEKLSDGSSGEVIPEIMRKTNALLRISGLTNRTSGEKLKKTFGITPEELPKVRMADGGTADAEILTALLLAHGTDGDYKKTGIRPEAAEVVALLDPKSLQDALLALANHLVKYENSKKKYLAFPICRYADEATMKELTKRAPSWCTVVSGSNASPLLEFRQAACYSDTQAAMLFADRFGDLGNYAELRGMDESTFRDTVLSDLDLSAEGKKTYDLGGTTVEVTLQDDLTFALLDTASGKAVKSIPKRNADPEKYEWAKADFAKLKTGAKKIVSSQNRVLFEAFMTGEPYNAKLWKKVRFSNPLLNRVAQLLVWSQDGKTFTLSKNGAIGSDGAAYQITDRAITVAHPRGMTPEERKAWQVYFASRGLKQPFPQVWEPVVDFSSIREDRYAGCRIPYYRFLKREKHGISVDDRDFHDSVTIYFKDCDASVERLDWGRHRIDMDHCFEIYQFSVSRESNYSNHIVAYLDQITLTEQVERDNDGALTDGRLASFTPAQISELLQLALDSKAARCTAVLLDYKHAHFPEFEAVEEFTLDW